MTAIPTENWPKPWLLQVHQQAVEHGFLFIQPISEEDARSLTARLYRIRRRSDTSMAAFIPPEYLLVTVGRWQVFSASNPPPEPYPLDEANPLGRLPIVYNMLPDGQPLPNIVPVEKDTFLAATAPVLGKGGPTQVTDVFPIRPEDLTLEPAQVEGYVENMLKKIGK